VYHDYFEVKPLLVSATTGNFSNGNSTFGAENTICQCCNHTHGDEFDWMVMETFFSKSARYFKMVSIDVDNERSISAGIGTLIS
jgi:hypothetical protein